MYASFKSTMANKFSNAPSNIFELRGIVPFVATPLKGRFIVLQ